MKAFVHDGSVMVGERAKINATRRAHGWDERSDPQQIEACAGFRSSTQPTVLSWRRHSYAPGYAGRYGSQQEAGMVHRWLHLNELGGDPWVLPIWAAVHQAAHAGNNVAPVGQDLGALGLNISTRLNFLPRIVQRINTAVAKLYREIVKRGPEHEYTPDAAAIAFDVDNDLKYELLVDLDSLLFELNSVCELMSSLFAPPSTRSEVDAETQSRPFHSINT
jgi:hypothetical protein